MGKHVGVTPESARLALIRAGGNMRAAARALGVSDSSVRWHLRNAPPVRATVRVTVPPDTHPDVAEAIIGSVRALLAASGVETTARADTPPASRSPEPERVPTED